MDSESLDRCIQTTLSALFPPFQDTSPTILCQVLGVVERCYRGDGLRYLLHFLLPAKQFLQRLQQDACLPYCGLLFRHEGWPLCLHEKVVIQLCHLDQRLLRPGDFYLLVSPSSASSCSSRHSASRQGPPTPRLLLCSVSTGSRHVEEQEIPELALSTLFTMAWLDSVNRDREQRGVSRIERALLSAHGDVFRVPWEDIVYPQFINRPRASLKEASVKDERINSSAGQDKTQEEGVLCSSGHSLAQDPTPLPCPVDQSTPSSDDSDSEGEYVELSEMPLPRFSPQKGSLTQLISQQHKARTSTQTPDKNKSPNVPTGFQSTPKHSSTASKDSLSSCTEETSNRSKPVEDKDGAVAVNGPVILIPIAQPETGDTFQCSEQQTQGTNSSNSLDPRPTRQDYREVSENMDLIDFEVDCVENVVLIEDRKDGESVSKSVEEEEDGKSIGQNYLEGEEVALEVDVVEELENFKTKDQVSELKEQMEDSNLCTESEDGHMQMTDSILDVHSELIDLESTHFEESNPEKSEMIVDTGSAYLETGDAQNVYIEEFAQKRQCENTVEISQNGELSLDAYIDNQLQKHTETSHTRVIYLEASDVGYFELFDSQSDKVVEKDETEMPGPHEDKIRDGLIDVLDQSIPDNEHCEMAEQSFVEVDTPCLDAQIEEAQNTQVETAETEDEETKVGLEINCAEQTESQEMCSKDIEESTVDLGVEERETQKTLGNLEMEQETNCGEDAPSDECILIELGSPCEEPEKLPEPSTKETMPDSSSVKDDIDNKIDGQAIVCLNTISKPPDGLIELSKEEDEQTTSPVIATPSAKDVEDPEIQSLLSEMVNTVESKVKSRSRKRAKRNSMRYLNTSVVAMEQQIDMLEMEFKHLQSKIEEMEHMKSEEKPDCTEDTPKVTTEEAATRCEDVEPKDDEKETILVENIENVAILSSQMPVEVESRYEVQDQPQEVETELANAEESKNQDGSDSESVQNSNKELQMEVVQESCEEQHPQSLEKPKTIEISEQPKVQNTNSHQDPAPSMDTNSSSIISQASIIEHQVTERAEPEIIQDKHEKEVTHCEVKQSDTEISENHKKQEPKVEATLAPVKSENGFKEDSKDIDKKLTNSEISKCQSRQPEMPKVQVNGTKVKKGETNHVFESRKGHNLKKVPTEGSNSLHLSNGSVPKSENPSMSRHMNHSVPLQLSKSHQSRFNRVLLSSGVLCLPGTRDRSGRALVTVNARSTVWSSPDCDSAELLQVLLYYSSTLRKEVEALGLTVMVDVRRAPPVPVFFTALRSLQESTPGSVHTVLLLSNKDSPVRLDKPPSLQVEMVHSMKSLQKHVDLRQLPVEFGGSFNFSQSNWLCYRMRVENLTNQCNNVISLLQKTIHVLETTALPNEAQNAEQLLSKYKAVMCSILQDSRLVQLQQEGGASLSRLRRDESSICATEDYRAAVETVSSLYDQVDEMLHRLVTLSNSKTQELQFILEFTGLEPGFTEVRSWLEDVGEARLKSLDEPEDSLELLIKNQRDFKDFCSTAHDWCRKGQGLLKRLEAWDNISSAGLQVYEVKVHAFWALLQDFSQRVTSMGKNIDRAVHLYSFLDQAYVWALAGMRHLAGVSMEDCTLPDKCPAVISCLEEYNRLHPPIADARFQEMRALAGELRGERGLRQWSFAWAKCQETKKMFDRKMEAALRTRDSAQRRRSDSEQSKSSSGFSRKSLSGLWSVKESTQTPPAQDDDTHSTCSSSTTPSPPRSSTAATPITSTPQHTPLLQRLFRSPTSLDNTKDSIEIPPSPHPSLQRLDSSCSFTSSLTPSLASSFTSSFTSPSLCSSSHTPVSRRQQLRKTQSFDCPATPEPSRYGASPRTLSEPARRGNTGVFIKGLEVTSTEAADRTLCPRMGAQGPWTGPASRSPSTQSINSVSCAVEQRPRGSKLRHIVEEMVTTEREYVRSLRYIIHHYFPEMERPDVPQDLRGKRSVVFGNLEKLLDFHSQFFLKELEACWKHPLRVPHCFLRHQEQFGLYALYSKNKPKSDALLAHHGNSFFRRKQVELGDKMDLSSYLLKPIQRMSKYALLLSDLIKEVGVSQSREAELVNLHAATNMVKFQLRHGNDLLAMDAIRDCDVNLKEQGQLIRQDEFTVWSGRRRCQRHVFLFEDLVLFSKPKRMEGGLDVYIYKHSFKTADVGLTESTGDDGLRFEIWFRRRTSKNQTFLLQASSAEVKQAWTNDIARLLWTQATRNKEMRLKEMVSMGVGNKPFLDIQPSDAAISDRAVHYIMKSRGARTRASIAVSVFDHSHSNPYKRSVTSDPSVASGPSSCTLLGPLNLHMFSQTLPPAGAAEGSFINSCIEEDEQEHETSSQPSMTTESSGSSSRCLSGSTGSDSGCVSSHLQEALQEEPNPSQASSSSSSSSNPSPPNKQHLNSPFISTNAGPVISPATVV